MARILVGWELGAGHGHVTRLLAVARGLAEHGHEPVMAVRSLVEPWPVLRQAPFPILQAPYWQSRKRSKPFHARAICDIFALQGFGDPDDLEPMVAAWQSLIDLVRPAVIVSDYSPTLCLAAFGVDPMVVVGDGFTVPPADLPEFPALRPHLPATLPQARMLEVVREVQRRRGRPAPEALPALFAAKARFICALPELDPYRAERREPVHGPFQEPPTPLPPPKKPRLFAYIAADYPRLKQAMPGLAAIKLPKSIFVRAAPSALKAQLAESGFHVFDAPAPLPEVLKEASLILHHGGIGTTEAALGIGRPQVLLPRHLEQSLTAKGLSELGVGVAVAGDYAPEAVERAVRKVSSEPAFGKRAQAFGEELKRRGPFDNVGKIVRRCLEIIDGAAS